MIGDKYSRRAFLGKVGVSLASTAAGSFGGYTVGENLSPRIPGWAAAKEMINIFEQAEYDWMAAYENRYAKDLEKPVRELEDLLGKNERNSEILQEHYQKMGLLDCDSYEDFRKVLDNSQSYVEAATTVERYRELKHRMELHALNMHDKIEETLPNFFVRIREKINEWDWGEEGTKKARNIYKARLEGLVSVYDVYRDNLAAQTELLELSADDFREAQETILSRVQDLSLIHI